ncbi:MAG TPA: hypothetical protein VMR21_00175 [Vicinamibacteria bacterium]|nr:hypothetical protein [Vicinamibacteria bacterium]
MRTFGGLLLLAGAVGFFYCSSQLSELPPVPEGVDLGRYLDYEAGKYELGRYAALVGAMVGLILSLFPKGR